MTDNSPERSDLHAATLALLKRRPYSLSVARIAEETGVSPYWIRALIADRMQDPSVLRLELVRDFLEAQEAETDNNV